MQVETTSGSPLLSPIKKEVSTQMIGSTTTSHIKSIESNNGEHDDLEFYDPNILLNIPRDVAFGYLILLTGGAVEYVAPTLEEVSAAATTNNNNTQQQQSNGDHEKFSDKKHHSQLQQQQLDEESASLAFAAITDGNVLHTCFGLKATANGSSYTTPPTIIGGKRESSSIFCCFPNSSALDALQLMLPHLSKNKLKMHKLIDTLREVRDLDYDVSFSEGGTGIVKVPLYIQVIQAYVNCFTSIVRYHDTKKYLTTDKKGEQKSGGMFINCCTNIFTKLNHFSSKKKNDNNPKLEQLQKDTLQDITSGFHGLKEDIWESLERMATETAFTGVSVEE